MTLVKIEDRKMFEELIAGRRTFRLALNGGAFTRYTIWKYRGNDSSQKCKFRVKAHFDDSVETVALDELFNPDMYHFSEGIEKGALYLESNKDKE